MCQASFRSVSWSLPRWALKKCVGERTIRLGEPDGGKPLPYSSVKILLRWFPPYPPGSRDRQAEKSANE